MGLLLISRATGKSEEDIVEAPLTEREAVHADVCARQLRDRGRRAVSIRAWRGEASRIVVQVHGSELGGEHALRPRTVGWVTEADL